MIRPRAYLAGPQIFRSDAHEHDRELKRLCLHYGIEGISALSTEISPPELPAGTPDDDRERVLGAEWARRIFASNVVLIGTCDVVIANMEPFRGPSMDVGTAWEMGLAHALALPVYGYSRDTRALAERVPYRLVSQTGGLVSRDDGMDIENFGLVENLMIACSVEGIWPDAEAAIMAVAGRMQTADLAP